METWVSITVAFMIIAAFLIGAYTMFRISEHYNRKIREAIARKSEDEPDVFLDSVVPVMRRDAQRQNRRYRTERHGTEGTEETK